jgi:hypothetical protein
VVGIMDLITKAEQLPEKIPEVATIPTSLVSRRYDMESLLGILENAEQLKETIVEVNREGAALTKRLDGILEKAREHGIELFMCPNCGTYSEVPHTHATTE